MADFLNLLSYLDYKKNPKGTGALLTVLSVLLFGFSLYILITEYKFILDGQKPLTTSIVYNCSIRIGCSLEISFQTKDRRQYNVTTPKVYSNLSHTIKYLKTNPYKILVDPFPIEFLILFFILSVISFVLSRILLKEGNKDDLMEKKLKETGKYYKTKFVKVESKNDVVSNYYTERKINAMGRSVDVTKKETIKVKKYWIITKLKIKGQKKALEFRSREIRSYDPTDDINELLESGKKIGVWINPSNPEEYSIDVSFLKI